MEIPLFWWILSNSSQTIHQFEINVPHRSYKGVVEFNFFDVIDILIYIVFHSLKYVKLPLKEKSQMKIS